MNNPYYAVELKLMVPTTLIFKVQAESPEQALKLVETKLLQLPQINPPKYWWNKSKKLAAKVFSYGTKLLLSSKTF